MKELKDILTNFDVEPSARGWETLSQRLDSVLPVQNSPTTPSHGAKSSIKGWGAASTSTKIMATTLGTLVMGGIITISVLATRHSHNSPTEPSSSSTVLIDSSSSHTTEVSPSTSESISLSTRNEATPEFSDYVVSTNDMDRPKETTESNAVPSTVAPRKEESHTVTSTTPTSVTVASSIPETQGNATASNTAARKAKRRHAIQEEDPIIQNMDQEDLNWEEPFKLEIPNVFTPNGDGYNDYFVIKGIEGCSKRQLIVRNRSGNIVFRSNSYENNWDGSDCPSGNYTYQFFYTRNGIEQTVSGNVAIIRK